MEVVVWWPWPTRQTSQSRPWKWLSGDLDLHITHLNQSHGSGCLVTLTYMSNISIKAMEVVVWWPWPTCQTSQSRPWKWLSDDLNLHIKHLNQGHGSGCLVTLTYTSNISIKAMVVVVRWPWPTHQTSQSRPWKWLYGDLDLHVKHPNQDHGSGYLLTLTYTLNILIKAMAVTWVVFVWWSFWLTKLSKHEGISNQSSMSLNNCNICHSWNTSIIVHPLRSGTGRTWKDCICVLLFRNYFLYKYNNFLVVYMLWKEVNIIILSVPCEVDLWIYLFIWYQFVNLLKMCVMHEDLILSCEMICITIMYISFVSQINHFESWILNLAS